jgi:hypothetical protein
MLVNDEDHEVQGTLVVALEDAKGQRVANQEQPFKVAALGQSTLYSDFKFPNATGDFLLRAIIEYGDGVSTQSRRHVKIMAGTH